VKIQDLLAEYELEIDDVRWYLSAVTAERILALKDHRHELIRYIWSGSLGDDLYDQEERFLAGMQNNLDSGIADEVAARETMKEIIRQRTRRYCEVPEAPEAPGGGEGGEGGEVPEAPEAPGGGEGGEGDHEEG
jgi:hypothetical protein